MRYRRRARERFPLRCALCLACLLSGRAVFRCVSTLSRALLNFFVGLLTWVVGVLGASRMLVVIGFLLRLIDVSLWVVTFGPIKTITLMLKSSPKVAPAPCFSPCSSFITGASP